MKLFLCGTCNGSRWRDEFIKLLNPDIEYFNPVVKDWDDDAKRREKLERIRCDYSVYCITPKMKGVYAIAEAIDDSHKKPHGTIFCLLEEYEGEKFDESMYKSLYEVLKMILNNGGYAFTDLKRMANFFNGNWKASSKI